MSLAPHTERSLQVVLADKPFGFMPICACEPSGERNATKPFDFRERSAFSLAGSTVTFLLYHVKAETTPTGQSFLPRMNAGGFQIGVSMRRRGGHYVTTSNGERRCERLGEYPQRFFQRAITVMRHTQKIVEDTPPSVRIAAHRW